METVKIENFEREHPGSSFPTWKRMTASQCSIVRTQFAELLELSDSANSLEVLRSLKNRAVEVVRFETNDSPPDLLPILLKLKIQPESQIYLNWSHFDDIDIMTFTDVNANLESIWYPTADDLEIFDKTQRWMLFITHFGTVQVTKL